MAVCRKAYVHPRVLALLSGEAAAGATAAIDAAPRRAGLSVDERTLMAYLTACG